MRTAALVLGIIGGVFGLFAALFALAVGGAASALNADGGGQVIGLGYAAFLVSVVAIVGGALAPKKPGAAALLLIGALLALLGRERASSAPPIAPAWTPPAPSAPSAPPGPSRYVPPADAAAWPQGRRR